MNLQVSVPYQKCVYKCPFCIAKGHKNENSFENLYAINKREWQKKLENVLKEGSYDSVVLTGECDPTQDMRYCDDVISVIRNMRGTTPTIEFTTHNQKFDNALTSVPHGHKVDVVTLSVTNVREYLNAWKTPHKNAFFSPIYRMVILLTKEFEFLTPDNFNTMGFDQITFKTLQYGEDGDVNRWIYENKMSDEHVEVIREIVEKFNSNSSCSVRLDTSCQTATGRYHIFRSDGKVYDSWETATPMEDCIKQNPNIEALISTFKPYVERDLNLKLKEYDNGSYYKEDFDPADVEIIEYKNDTTPLEAIPKKEMEIR
jgi:hypothetical protein